MNRSVRKFLWLAVRIGISALCVAYVVHKTQWADALGPDGRVISPGFLRTLGIPFQAIIFLLVFAIIGLLGLVRWFGRDRRAAA